MYQFIHIELYAETVSKKAVNRRTKENKNGRQNSGTRSLLSVRQVVAEANRESGAYPHVQTPLEPTKLYGDDLIKVEQLAIDSKIGQCDSHGRKLRTDTPVLLAGITSYPYDQYNANQDKFEHWLQDNITWLKNIYGDNLKNVTLHLDEEHPHIHFYAISPTGRAKDIHPGYKAESLVQDKTDSKEKKLAYVKAMQDFQDQYFLNVATKHGMLRTGPKLQRKSRAEYNQEKANANILARKIEEVERHEEDALKAAKDKRNAIYKDLKLKMERMIFEVQRLKKEALSWAKDASNMSRLNKAEADNRTLNTEIQVIKNERDYFVEENKELQRRLTALSSLKMKP
jgi:hypothetical protein